MPIDTAKNGYLWEKLLVPSNGSMIQRNVSAESEDVAAVVIPPSSPSISWSGYLSWMCLMRKFSEAWSASVTRLRS